MAQQLCETTPAAGISATGFFYSDLPPVPVNPSMRSHLVRQIQGGYISNPESFNMSAGMDQMIGFSKNLQQQSTYGNTAMWKCFTGKPRSLPGSSTSRLITPEFTANYYDQFATAGISEAKIIGPHDPATWQDNRLLVDDSSITYAFPCEGIDQRPSQGGLSLSLSSRNPTSFDLQPFGIRHADHHQNQQDAVSSTSTDHQVLYGKSGNTQQQQDWFMAKAPTDIHHGHIVLKNSKYLVPAQELLSEFCSLGTWLQTEQRKEKLHKNKRLEEKNGSISSAKQSLINSVEFVELQRRKTKLLSLLEEVDRRYRHYCNQMKTVVSSFEVVAGDGAAKVYSELASKAMSRHFRCLKDGILNEVKATAKAMGEKNPIIETGTGRGETPMLRVIDQTLRQERAFQQMSLMDQSHPWRPQRGLPERAVSLLRAWLFEHFLHPYPSDVDKHILARQTGLSRSQVSNWFINARVRLWKPMVEEMYLEETKEQEKNMASSDEFTSDDIDDNSRPIHTPLLDQKPTPDRLLQLQSECLSSVLINNNSRISCNPLPPPHDHLQPAAASQHQTQMEPVRVRESSYGSIELDFTSYVQPSAPMVSYATHNSNQSFNGGRVSLTLGLHQHGGSGVSLAFAPATQNSMFYSGEEMEECHPYRNLMGAQY